MGVLADYTLLKHIENNLVDEFQMPRDIAWFVAMFISKNYNISLKENIMQEETYTIKLDADSMNEAVVKFLVQCYRDNEMFREDDGIQDSILDVVRYCSTASEYDSILAELGIE